MNEESYIYYVPLNRIISVLSTLILWKDHAKMNKLFELNPYPVIWDYGYNL